MALRVVFLMQTVTNFTIIVHLTFLLLASFLFI